MEAKPHFPAPAKGVGAALGRRKKGAAHGGVPATRDPRLMRRNRLTPSPLFIVTIQQANTHTRQRFRVSLRTEPRLPRCTS